MIYPIYNNYGISFHSIRFVVTEVITVVIHNPFFRECQNIPCGIVYHSFLQCIRVTKMQYGFAILIKKIRISVNIVAFHPCAH